MTNLFDFLGDDELNGIRDEFRVLLDSILDTLLLEVLSLVLLQVKADLGATTDRWVDGVKGDSEGTSRSRLPDVLLIVVVF